MGLGRADEQYLMKKLALVLALFCAVSVPAATRYYLPSSGTPPVSPTFDSNWTDTASVVRIRAVTSYSNTAMTDQTVTVAGFATTLFKQYVSDPIGVVNFNATTVSGVIRGSAAVNTLQNGDFAVGLVHSNGTRVLLLTTTQLDSAFSTTATTRFLAATTLPNVTSQAGDRILIEIGADNGSSTARAIIERFGDVTASGDFLLNNTQTTDLDPWLEFSATITSSSASDNFLGFFSWIQWNFAKFWRHK
jgi:hypothetical protein